MKKTLFSIILSAAVSLTVWAADITIVDNQPMQQVAGVSGWYSYSISQLEDGASFSVMFNNGGWSGGQTEDFYVESASSLLCFSSNGSDAAIYEIPCPATDVEELALAAADAVYSKEGCIYGNAYGAVQIYTTGGACVQVIDAEGSYVSRRLPSGIYIVRCGDFEVKIIV